jgi:hypothetical protein
VARPKEELVPILFRYFMGAGGPAFKLQEPPHLRVARPSRTLRRAGTTTAYTTVG